MGRFDYHVEYDEEIITSQPECNEVRDRDVDT